MRVEGIEMLFSNSCELPAWRMRRWPLRWLSNPFPGATSFSVFLFLFVLVESINLRATHIAAAAEWVSIQRLTVILAQSDREREREGGAERGSNPFQSKLNIYEYLWHNSFGS